MKRRDLLRGAALAAAGRATAALAMTAARADEPPAAQRLGKIALEEHFLTPDFLGYFAETFPNIDPNLRRLAPVALQDFGDRRLEIMDRNGVDFVVLSISGPGVQFEKDAHVALKRAKSATDCLAGEIQKRPQRYGGFAHLAMHDPAAAADELERSMRDLGFHGALINGQTTGEYLDLD